MGRELPYGVFWTSARTMCAVVSACKAAQDNWVILNDLELASYRKMFDELDFDASSEDEEEEPIPLSPLQLSLFLRDLVSIYSLSLCLSTSLPLCLSLSLSTRLSLCLSISFFLLFLSSLSLSLFSFPVLISIYCSYPPPSLPSTGACH
jgi:hypothetical protein